ncbi:mechanosensitive ion channel family protein [Roseateles sp. 22389]|uniref:mechanosensitive ion channel family protein n=1 Tax=Roseateles sp. 22389 TaxID=3453916 RepID=UPI003F85267A
MSVRVRLNELAGALSTGPSELVRVWQHAGDALISGAGLVALTYSLVLFLMSAGVEWLYWTYAASPLRAIELAPTPTPALGFRQAWHRLALLALGQVLFAGTALGGLAFFRWPPGFDAVLPDGVQLVIALRAAWLIADTVWAPGRPQGRLLNLAPQFSRRAVLCSVAMSFLLGSSWLLAPLLEKAEAGHAADLYRLVAATITFVLTWRFKYLFPLWPGSAARPPGHKTLQLPRSIIFTTVLTAIYGVWLAAGTAPTVFVADIVLLAMAQWSLRAIFHFWHRPAAEGQGELGSGASTLSLTATIGLSVARHGAVAIAACIALSSFGVPLDQVLSGHSPAAPFVRDAAGLLTLSLATNVVWVAVRISIDRRLAALKPSVTGQDHHARLRTLLPLVRTALGILLLTTFILTALWDLGIQIGPLLAGAGAFGVVFGFGAQALVRDVIAGVFYLIEDAFRVGEYIEIGATIKGKVERITLRSVALRHHDGPLHFVPYGSLGTVRNNSRDWIVQKFDLPLPIDVDSELIMQMIRQVGEAMQQDPATAPALRESMKVKLYRIDPGIKIFRCKIETVPGEQFDMRVEALRRIEIVMREAGIPFASGVQTIVVPPGQNAQPD